jgi:hypothetical protein
MKLIKHLPWLLAGLPVAAIIGFSLRSDPGQSARPPASKAVSAATVSIAKDQDTSSPQFAADGSRIKPPSLTEIAARQRYQEAKQRVDESKERRVEGFKKLAEKYTPEFIARTADGLMQRRGAGYQKLFASWNLDAQTIHEALGIMREREIRLLENRGNYFKDSSTVESGKKVAFDNQTEDLTSREELSLLLGESRATEILNAAKQMLKDELKATLARSGTALPLEE